MPRTPRRYVVHLLLRGGHQQRVSFGRLEDFHRWYDEVLTPAAGETFVNVPLSDLEGEYLVLRASGVLGLRVEPIYASLAEAGGD